MLIRERRVSQEAERRLAQLARHRQALGGHAACVAEAFGDDGLHRTLGMHLHCTIAAPRDGASRRGAEEHLQHRECFLEATEHEREVAHVGRFLTGHCREPGGVVAHDVGHGDDRLGDDDLKQP
jgi:hypothetical protein